MQNMMRMVGFGENLGSGFSTIVKTWNDEHWLRPDMVENWQLQIVNLTLTVNRTADILNLIVEDNSLSITEMAQCLGIARSTLALHLKKMQEQGLLQRIGADKNGHWGIRGQDEGGRQ